MNNVYRILKQIGKPNLKLMGKGMESYVFELDENRVLKVYNSDNDLNNLLRLKSFYESLDTSNVDFATPLILDVQRVDSNLLVVEKRLIGMCPDKNYLQTCSQEVLELLLNNYVDTLFDIQKITTSFLRNSEPLDLTQKFFLNRSYSSWNELLLTNLNYKSSKLKNTFSTRVENFEDIVSALITQIKQIQVEKVSLIHGDFFPANCMISEEYKISAILDFGILTTIGDSLFDIALGGIFADMFGEISTIDIKKYVFKKITNRLDLNSLKHIYLYILFYSIVSADIYAKNDLEDGHFLWCVSNLRNREYLKYL